MTDQLGERLERLVRSEGIEAAWAEVQRVMRDRLSMLPRACAVAICSANPSETAEVEAIMREKVEEALEPINRLDKYIANMNETQH